MKKISDQELYNLELKLRDVSDIFFKNNYYEFSQKIDLVRDEIRKIILEDIV